MTYIEAEAKANELKKKDPTIGTAEKLIRILPDNADEETIKCLIDWTPIKGIEGAILFCNVKETQFSVYTYSPSTGLLSHIL